MRTIVARWLALIAVCGGLIVALFALHQWSPSLAGPAGDVFRSSLARDLSVYAYFYTEVGDPAEFLEEQGRYGFLVPGDSVGPQDDSDLNIQRRP